MVTTNERISNGRITIADIARQAGVSKATVSMALRGMPEIRNETRDRINKLAKEMGYRADPSLSKIAASRWRNRQAQQGSMLAMIDLVDSSSEQPDDECLLSGAKERADELGYGFESFKVASERELSSLSRVLYHRGVEGVVINVSGNIPYLDQFPWQRFSCVMLGGNRDVNGINSVDTDERSELSIALNNVFEKGYKRVGLVLSGDSLSLERDFVLKGAFEGVMRKRFGSEAIAPVLMLSDEDSIDLGKWAKEQNLDVVIAYDDDVFGAIENTGVGFVSLRTARKDGAVAGISDVSRRVGKVGVDSLDQLVRVGNKGLSQESVCCSVSGSWMDGRSLD
ncbi:LacI family DNA-binding transcriptional regulator [Pelagicoccus mobilis]|uniref:LacI family DNA-binding transcriptional regulator n=1 Tax=Pelagicoccus mobilis TaxID=415221 RepID=A0A934S153_9BACT|nr:LacI family DNA-binding transcriptional regulator [Pelagicoccus mobilis]MBK1880442.1 LacI family DNA-binding transcriptional regulator [Pelagicoccus mobilis]